MLYLRFPVVRCATVACCTALLCGCESGPERVVVAGNVSYRGEALSRGTISFFPTAGTQGAPVIVAISNGKYKVDSSGGLPIGDYQVAIVGFRSRGAEKTDTASVPRSERPPPDAEMQYLPAKYNDRTQLKASVDASANPLSLDFALNE
jgi:hypothetical protein